MSAHVLFSLLNELRKSDTMLAKHRILSLFLNSVNKWNNTEPPMIDSIHHRTLKLHKNRFFGVNPSRSITFYATL